MLTTKVYKIGKTKRLIDMNGLSVNFEIEFKLRSKSNVPFQATVVDQNMLDSGDQLEYQLVTNGVLTGALKHDKGVYQNYFLILKADRECEVEVELKKVEIEKAFVPVEEPPHLDAQPFAKTTVASPIHMVNNPKEYDWSKVVLTVIVIGGLCLAGYWVWTNHTRLPIVEGRNVEGRNVEGRNVEGRSVESRSVSGEVPLPEPVHIVELERENVVEPELGVVSNPLLDKLKKLSLTS